jgi:hypothetical protein
MSSEKGTGCRKYGTLPFEKINKNFYMVYASLSIEIEGDKLRKRFQYPPDGPVRFEDGSVTAVCPISNPLQRCSGHVYRLFFQLVNPNYQ